jgi:hypothetical protein
MKTKEYLLFVLFTIKCKTKHSTFTDQFIHGTVHSRTSSFTEQFIHATVPKSNRKIAERDKIDTPNTDAHDI